MSTEGMDAEELKVFFQEAEEQLQLMDEDIIRLEKEAGNEDLLQGIFRAAHTLKGSSGMLGFQTMAELTHSMEDTLDKLRSGTLVVSPELVDALLQSLDALKVLMEEISSGNEGALDIAPLVATLQAVSQGPEDGGPVEADAISINTALAADPTVTARLEKAAADGLSLYLVRIVIEQGTDWAAVRCLQVVNELSGLGEIVCSVPSQADIEQEKVGQQFELILASPDGPEAAKAAVSSIDDLKSTDVTPWSLEDASTSDNDQRNVSKGPPDDTERRTIDLGSDARGKSQQEQLEMAASKIETQQSVRIDIEKLDALMNMVGELVIDRTRVAQVSKSLKSRYKEDELIESLTDTCTHIAKVVDELHEGMMQVRMMPVDMLFNKFPRLVRDVARATGKNVEFIVEGGDTEIDRSIIEKVKDPLVHLLRNAVDHGVESPDIREAAGKPAQALVKLSAHHEQGHILIRLEDDGKGIDAETIRQAAVTKGIITADAAERLSDPEAIDLIFESGMSTAEKTTEVSGRGVGMDVVRRSIGAINGLVKIDTVVGKGTTFTLQLPLTLATFRGLLVESANAVYAIPLSYVLETSRLEESFVKRIVDTEVVSLKGSVLPLFRLSSIARSPSQNGNTREEEFIVIVKAGDRTVAVAVDALREQQEIVVKALGSYIGQTDGIAGASILGDGQVVLLLDVASLVKAATQGSAARAELERRAS